MGFFDFFKVSFGFGSHHGHSDNPRHHRHSRYHSSRHEEQMVRNGRGVYAWIERSGSFYSGDIPGVSGIMSARMEDSFEACLDKLTENINESISASFSSFKQEVSYDEIIAEHPEAEIVFIPIYKK